MDKKKRPYGLGLLALLLLAAACASEGDAPRATCDPGFSRCGDLCVDLEKDAGHCGACEVACSEDQACKNSVCVLECSGETVACGGSCVDLASDGGNCGSCGEACGEGETCSKGACVVSCGEGEERCGSSCVNVQSDVKNCSACGNACASGQACIDGSCGIQCDQGEALCGGSCVETFNDDQHCGACGQACDENETCDGGTCTCLFATCGGRCVDTATNEEHCGSCDSVCGEGANTIGGSCAASTCTLDCAVDYADCDGKAATGCETLVAGNSEHCGACDNRCSDAANVASAVCDGYTCRIQSCNDGFADCDGNPQTGCEVEYGSDVENCGGCNVVCAELANNVAAPACTDGVCALSCADGWADCDDYVGNGCETDLKNNAANCGACGNVCEGFDTCNDGVCFDRQWAQWPMPSDLPEDYVTDATAGIVTDLATGLVWERKPLAVPMDLQPAKQYCRDLRLDGKSDWRLPTMIELISLLHFHENWAPALHLTHFPNTPYDHWYQTATPHASAEDSSWQINFEWGMLESYADKLYYVRCVRGGKGDDGPRFVVQGETVLAPKNRLMWQRNPPATRYFVPDAKRYCTDLVLGGFDDWRLPTAKEIQTLVDRREDIHVYEPEYFPGTAEGNFAFYATSSVYQKPGGLQHGSSWIGNFFNGLNEYGNDDLKVRVRCVRGYDPGE